MFQAFVEVALSPFKRSPIVVRTARKSPAMIGGSFSSFSSFL